MLGDLLAEEKGRITGQRILKPDLYGKPRIEISAIGEGKIRKKIEYMEIWTYITEQRSDGVQYGQGIGIMTIKGSNEVVSVKGQGIGRITESGIMRYVGIDFYSTSPTGKLSFLNESVGIFEYEPEKTGNYTAKVWEWR
ncbi:MAG: hypothetical protein R3321_03395 [Nitrososphaeraceae archaeon]|nr:hypothetical protein [Nitrososphaeraceae archaeon]